MVALARIPLAYRGVAKTGARTTGLLAAVALTIAGCGHSLVPSGGPRALDARQAISLAASQARQVTSLAMNESISMKLPPSALSGLPSGAAGVFSNGRLSFTVAMKMQLKPTLLADIQVSIPISGSIKAIHEILTSHAIYESIPGLPSTSPSKPWLEISLNKLPAGMNLSKLLQQSQGGNPLSTNPLSEAPLFKAATHLKVVGSQSVDGVQATEYSGTVSLAAMVSHLPGLEQQLLSALPASVRSAQMPFKIWIDNQHQLRKIVLQMSFLGIGMTVTANVTSINQPVTITPPPASQVTVARV